MARLLTVGFEAGSALAEGGGTGITVVASPVRTGAGAAEFAVNQMVNNSFSGGVVGRTYYARAYIRFPAAPPAAMTILTLSQGINHVATASIDTSRRIYLNSDTGTTSAALAVDTWHRIEVSATVVTGAGDLAALRVNGTDITSTSGSVTDSALSSVWIGRGGLGTFSVYVDDLAMNDDQGADQNSWPGDGSVIVLKPASDSARGANWTAGAGGTSNLWDAVDNTPPVGVALASATDTSQIKNAAKDTTGTYDAAMAAYDTALAAGDTVTLVQPFAAIGNSAGTSRSMGVQSATNPATAEATGGTVGTAGTYPTGWTTLRGNVAYGDITDRATPAVVKIRKNANVTDSAMACFMGMTVEYVPGAAPPAATSAPPRPTRRRQQHMTVR